MLAPDGFVARTGTSPSAIFAVAHAELAWAVLTAVCSLTERLAGRLRASKGVTMKVLRRVASMVCFIAGLLSLTGGISATLASVWSFSVQNVHLSQDRFFSELALAAVPGMIVALVGIGLLVCARALDARGPVLRYGKRKPIGSLHRGARQRTYLRRSYSIGTTPPDTPPDTLR